MSDIRSILGCARVTFHKIRRFVISTGWPMSIKNFTQ